MSDPATSEPTPLSSDLPAAPKVLGRGTPTSLLSTLAVVLTSVLFAVPVTVSRVVEGVLDSANPDHLKDTGAGLAYLSQILGISFTVLGVLLVAIIVIYVLIYRRERTLDALKLPLLLLAVQVILGIIALIFNALANSGA